MVTFISCISWNWYIMTSYVDTFCCSQNVPPSLPSVITSEMWQRDESSLPQDLLKRLQSLQISNSKNFDIIPLRFEPSLQKLKITTACQVEKRNHAHWHFTILLFLNILRSAIVQNYSSCQTSYCCLHFNRWRYLVVPFFTSADHMEAVNCGMFLMLSLTWRTSSQLMMEKMATIRYDLTSMLMSNASAQADPVWTSCYVVL